jgi:lipopolysaccharide export LptBFGC system permease protein LptF
MVLEEGTRHSTKLEDPSAYEVLKFDQTIVSLNPESVFPRTGPARGERELRVEELQARAVELQQQGISPHRPIMEIHKKFSVPVACFVFAVLGLALGASNRKDGKLAAFVVGIAVIFAYYVIMFTAEALTKGFWIPAWLSMWTPNIILGALAFFLLINRARSADQPIRISLPQWLTRWTRNGDVNGNAPRPAGEVNLAAPKARPLIVIRVPHFELPRPTLLDGYIAKQYLRILAMTTVGMLGLFYISTFIDLSDKVFKGQATLWMIGEFLFWSTPEYLSYVTALAVLLSALVTVGLLTKNSELIVMRACGISLYRTALPMVAFALAGSVFLFGMEERVMATANQRADRLMHVHSHRPAPDVWRAQSQVDRRQQG